MATIIPFKGIRYNPEKSDLAEVVTPPYDVIDQEAQERYYRKSPHNIIRLEYGKVFPQDHASDNRYTRAAGLFKDWLDNDILTRDPEPAFYLYEQEFNINGKKTVRTGFIGAVKLEPYEKKIVLPHEETLPKHKADRLQLMNACKSNFSPVFSLYSDREMAVTGVLRSVIGDKKPHAVFTDESDEIHRLWVITDPAVIDSVQKKMEDKRIFIADGHHRYETALNYKNQRPVTENKNQTLSDYIMMMLVNLYDPGLVVLPTHRLVKNANSGDIDALLNNLNQHFTLKKFDLNSDGSNFQSFLTQMSQMDNEAVKESVHRHVFGLYLGTGKLYLAALKEEHNLPQLMPQGKSQAWQGLDVSVLHHLILQKHLGIGPEHLAQGDHVTYTREEEGALKAVEEGEYQLAVFLNPTKVEEVTEVAANAEKMPQKSTFFYPKVITGMVINPLE